MENYIVRIYRRDATDPHKLAGIFESVEQQTRNTFNSLNSLIELLAPNRGIQKSSGASDDRGINEKPEAVSVSK